MPVDVKPRCTCRKPKRESMSAPRKISAGPVRSDSMWSRQTGRKKAQFPKPVNATHVMCERALQTWTKWQRADSLSEMKYLPKPVNQVCELHICRKLFYRLTPELSRPVAGRRTRASVAQKHVADATTRGRLERIVRLGRRSTTACNRPSYSLFGLFTH